MSRKRELTLLSDEEFSNNDDVLFPSRRRYLRAISDYDTGDSSRETYCIQSSPNEASTSSGCRRKILTLTQSSSDESVIKPRTNRQGKSQCNIIGSSDSSDSGLPIGFKTQKRKRLHLSSEEESVTGNSCSRPFKKQKDTDKPCNRQTCLNKLREKGSHLHQTVVSLRNQGENDNILTDDLHPCEGGSFSGFQGGSSNKAVKSKTFRRITRERYDRPQGKAESYKRSERVNSRRLGKPNLNKPKDKVPNRQNTYQSLGPGQIGRKQSPQENRKRTLSGSSSYPNKNGHPLRNLQPCDSSSSSSDSDSSSSSDSDSSSSSDDASNTVVLCSRTAVSVRLNYEHSEPQHFEIPLSYSNDISGVYSGVESSESSSDSDFVFPIQVTNFRDSFSLRNAILEPNEEDDTNHPANRDNVLNNTNIAINNTPVGASELFSDNSSDFDNGHERCPICLITFISQELGSPSSCDHLFCLKCINEWSNNKKTCPIDRKPFNSISVRSCVGGTIIREIFLPSTRNDCRQSQIMAFFEDIFGTGIMYQVAARVMNQVATIENID